MMIFDTPGTDAAYDKWLDPPFGHIEECNCPRCHKEHALEECAPLPDFRCCRDEIDMLIDEGRWCAKHGGAYMDFDGTCVECLEEHNGRIEKVS